MNKIFNERAGFLDGTLVVADLHLGLEKEYVVSGVRIPDQMGKMLERIKELILGTGTKRLLILGDIKHNLPKASWNENRNIPVFIRQLESLQEVILVKGNHDGDIEKIVPSKEAVSFYEEGGNLFLHGHRRPPALEYSRILLAHNHPALEFTDALGSRIKEPVWVETRLKKQAVEKFGLKKTPRVTMIPPFNKLITGTPVNREGQKFMGPLFTHDLIDIDNARCYLLDGTDMGKIKDLKSL